MLRLLPDGSAQRPFVVFALPRSRTAWLAHWLHSPEHPVGHDIAIECARKWDFLGSFERGMRGSVETAAVEGWRQIVRMMPQVRLLTVRRPIAEVVASLGRFGLDAGEELARRDALLDEVEAAGAERIEFTDLMQRGCRKWIWRYLLPEALFDPSRDAALAETNIQVDMSARIAQLIRRGDFARSLRKDLANATD